MCSIMHKMVLLVKYLICLVVFVFITNLKKKLFNSEFLCNKICECIELIQVRKDLVYSFIYKTVVFVLSAFCSVSLLLHNVINSIIYSCELVCTVLQKIHFCHIQLTWVWLLLLCLARGGPLGANNKNKICKYTKKYNKYI